MRLLQGWGSERVVALLAEGVDRNITVTMRTGTVKVALLAEGVDRNTAPPVS